MPCRYRIYDVNTVWSLIKAKVAANCFTGVLNCLPPHGSIGATWFTIYIIFLPFEGLDSKF